MFAITGSQSVRGHGRWDVPLPSLVSCVQHVQHQHCNTAFPSPAETKHLVLWVAPPLAPVNGRGESNVLQTLLVSDTFWYLAHELHAVVTSLTMQPHGQKLVLEAFHLFAKTYIDSLEFYVSQKCRIQQEGRGSFEKSRLICSKRR